MLTTRRRVDGFIAVVMCITTLAWGARKAKAAQSELCACICAAVQNFLKPEKVPEPKPGGGTVNRVRLNGTHDSGSTENPPAGDKANTDMQNFATELRRCVKNHDSNGNIFEWDCDCVIPDANGNPQTFSVLVSCDVDGDGATCNGSADIVIAISGNEPDTATSDGEDATATNTSEGGAAVAVGGNGGGNEANPGHGGKGDATTKTGDAAGVGGAGGDPPNDESAGGDGGSARGRQLGIPGIPGDGSAESGGVTGGPSGTPGFHGGGAWAKSGRIGGPGTGAAARSGHGGSRYNDSSNKNYAPGSAGY